MMDSRKITMYKINNLGQMYSVIDETTMIAYDENARKDNSILIKNYKTKLAGYVSGSTVVQI